MLITPEGFIELDLTPAMTVTAALKASAMGPLRNSIRNGAGNLAGFLGEEAVLASWTGSTSHNTFQHDIMFENITFEVKTKDRTVAPRLSYEASVANYNPNQNAHFYVFVSLYRPNKGAEYTKAYITGIIDKQEYLNRSTFLPVGAIDPSNGWVVKAACYNLPYSGLERFESWA